MALLGPAPAVALARRLHAGRRASSRRARSTACSSTSPRSRRSRCVGGARDPRLVGDFDPATATRCGSRRVVLVTFLATNTLNFADGRGRALFALRRPVRAMLRSFVTALPSEFATGLLTAERGVHLRPPRHGVGRPGRGGPLRLPLHPAHQRPGRGARRGARPSARASSRRCRWACSRRCCRRCRCATR